MIETSEIFFLSFLKTFYFVLFTDGKTFFRNLGSFFGLADHRRFDLRALRVEERFGRIPTQGNDTPKSKEEMKRRRKTLLNKNINDNYKSRNRKKS
jgi:hypothetical protein